MEFTTFCGAGLQWAHPKKDVAIGANGVQLRLSLSGWIVDSNWILIPVSCFS